MKLVDLIRKFSWDKPPFDPGDILGDSDESARFCERTRFYRV